MGKPQRIERSSLIGQERTSIITSGVDRVYDITVDQKERRLYWVDAGRHTLESSDYNGRNRRLLTRMNSVKFTSVVIFGVGQLNTSIRVYSFLILHTQAYSVHCKSKSNKSMENASYWHLEIASSNPSFIKGHLR